MKQLTQPKCLLVRRRWIAIYITGCILTSAQCGCGGKEQPTTTSSEIEQLLDKHPELNKAPVDETLP